MDNNFRKSKEMDEKEVASLLRSLAVDATEYLYDTQGVIRERAQALSYYRGEVLGNEEDHTSQFVTRDVREVVDNALANQMRIFCGDDESVVSFTSMGPEDTQAAKQATDYIHHCLMNKNYGVQIIGTWMKDALLQKNGIVKFYWDEWEEIDKMPFEDMPESEMDSILANTDLQLDYDPEETKQDPSIQVVVDPQTGLEVEIEVEGESLFTGRFKKVTLMSGVKVMNIAPEDFLIDRYASDIHDAKYVSHKSKMTISDVRLMGFEVSDDELAGNSEGDETSYGYESYEAANRSGQGYSTSSEDDTQPRIDASMRIVTLLEEYAYFDEDGDGIAELHKVIRIGDLILENLIVSTIPFAAICPYPTTHTFYGSSVADQVVEIQYANSMMYRGLLDNMALANNGRFAVQEGMVNIEQMLDNRSNSIVETRMPPSMAIQPIPHSDINPMTFSLMQMLDASKDKRSGVPSMGTGISGNELKSHAGATANLEYMSRADASLEQIARNFTTGFKRLYKGIYQLYRENFTGMDIMYTAQGAQEISPSNWPRRDMINVQVALGRHDKSQKAAELEKLLALELQSAPLQQLVSTEKGYNLLIDTLTLKGIDFQRYIMNPQEAMNNPEKQEQMQKQQEEEAMQKQLLVAEKQADIQKTQAQAEKLMADIELDKGRLAFDYARAEAELELEGKQGRPVAIL